MRKEENSCHGPWKFCLTACFTEKVTSGVFQGEGRIPKTTEATTLILEELENVFRKYLETEAHQEERETAGSQRGS